MGHIRQLLSAFMFADHLDSTTKLYVTGDFFMLVTQSILWVMSMFVDFKSVRTNMS